MHPVTYRLLVIVFSAVLAIPLMNQREELTALAELHPVPTDTFLLVAFALAICLVATRHYADDIISLRAH